MTISYEDILRIRARDRQRFFVMTLVASLLHFFAILFIRFPDSPPKVFDIPPPENLVVLRRFTPDSFPRGLPPGLQVESPAASSLLPEVTTEGSADEAPASVLGTGLVPPKVLELAEAACPEAARQAKVRGIVVLDVEVNQDGSVGEIKIISGLGNSGCDEAAIEAVKRSRFAPGTLQGVPVEAAMTLEFRFR